MDPHSFCKDPDPPVFLNAVPDPDADLNSVKNDLMNVEFLLSFLIEFIFIIFIK